MNFSKLKGTIEKDISHLSNLIKKDISLPYLNRGKAKKSHDEVYTDEMKEIVYRIYRKDFEIFNY